MVDIPDIVFFVMGAIGLLLLVAIYFKIRNNPKKKRRPGGMSLEELGYRRSRYLYHARHNQQRNWEEKLSERN